MDAVLTAMVEGRIGPGDHTKLLFQTAREKIKFDHCLAMRSPAVALGLALKSLNLEQGQGLILSALSPLYYERVIRDLGLVPIYCDILPSTVCVGRESVEKALALKPQGLDIRCIVLHHSLGYLSDLESIAELGIPVIEDCSHSFGTSVNDAAGGTCAVGNIVAEFNILGLEEKDMLNSGGGALLYSLKNRSAAASGGQSLRNLPELPPEYGLPGMNAAFAAVNFKEAEKSLAKRREIAQLYTHSSLRTRHRRFVQPDIQGQAVEYNNYAFALTLETGMKEVTAYAKRKEIAVESAFENTIIGSGIIPPEQCPVAYSLSLRTVLFPIYPRLSMTDAGKVAKLIQTLP